MLRYDEELRLRRQLTGVKLLLTVKMVNQVKMVYLSLVLKVKVRQVQKMVKTAK